jgi:hypothetical protein
MLRRSHEPDAQVRSALVKDLLLLPFIVQLVPQLRDDEPRNDDVDPDLLGCQLVGERLRERDDARVERRAERRSLAGS